MLTKFQLPVILNILKITYLGRSKLPSKVGNLGVLVCHRHTFDSRIQMGGWEKKSRNFMPHCVASESLIFLC